MESYIGLDAYASGCLAVTVATAETPHGTVRPRP